jgi:hypothetical protein
MDAVLLGDLSVEYLSWQKRFDQGRICWDVYGYFGTHAGFPTVYRTDSGYQCLRYHFRTLKSAKLFACNFARRNPF